tara:strand:- start:3165 stop:3728 length:564 start_codon:yes stop_codon:yes gene_type:complete
LVLAALVRQAILAGQMAPTRRFQPLPQRAGALVERKLLLLVLAQRAALEAAHDGEALAEQETLLALAPRKATLAGIRLEANLPEAEAAVAQLPLALLLQQAQVAQAAQVRHLRFLVLASHMQAAAEAGGTPTVVLLFPARLGDQAAAAVAAVIPLELQGQLIPAAAVAEQAHSPQISLQAAQAALAS